MPLTSNCVFHFTPTRESLEGILVENFKISYCVESIHLDPSKTKKPAKFGVPMVSFCDIPLSQVKEHISKYGAYALGLSKDWAKAQGLCPVQYVASGSFYAKSLRRNIVGDDGPNSIMNYLDSVEIDLGRYCKMYEGPLVRPKKTYNSYRFYDEREWRYVPERSDDFPAVIAVDQYRTKEQKDEANSAFGDLRLKFGPEDIRYIIVDGEDDIPLFIDTIRRAKGTNYSHSEVERLTTRILTKSQIENDF